MSQQTNNMQFAQLMRAGHVALVEGKRRRAHNLWQQAAMMRPYEEQVWLALLNVLESEEDRRVCLENIIAINPQNLQARQQLSVFGADDTQPLAVPRPARPGLTRSWRHYLLRIVESVLIGGLIAVAISILRYGMGA